MPSIINGLFSGRSGISSHGTAIAVIGDNISNASTLGYKTSRAEFEDLIAGGQTSGKVVGAGSSVSAISTIFEQGTLEFTNRPLDLAIDGNGFFAVQNVDGSKYYTRAGNFKVDSTGFITNQSEDKVLGFPSGGSGVLEPLNINDISQDSVSTNNINIAGNVDAQADVIASSTIATPPAAGDTPAGTVDYADLNENSEFSTVVEVFDSLGAAHTLTFFFYHTDDGEYTVRGYVNSEEVDGSGSFVGFPRQIEGVDSLNAATDEVVMGFEEDGTRSAPPATGSFDIRVTIPWNNGSDPTQSIEISFNPFTSYASASNIQSINQDGQGVGAVTSISIEENGDIFALLSNGQSTVIGTLGLVSFSNPEGLTRVGNQLLQQSSDSGAPIIGKPLSGTFGAVQSGSVELSTVDIADQFVKLITLQRGFQANSRIITTINQLLNELIQLA